MLSELVSTPPSSQLQEIRAADQWGPLLTDYTHDGDFGEVLRDVIGERKPGTKVVDGDLILVSSVYAAQLASDLEI
jgi:hypothetical protein